MKKVLAITCLLVLAASSMAVAAEPHWRIYLGADNGAGENPGPVTTLGAQPGQLDNYSTSDLEASYSADVTNATAWAVGRFVDQRDGNVKTWTKDVKSDVEPPAYPNGEKIWDIRVAALPQYPFPRIGLEMKTVSATILPPQVLPSGTCQYSLRLIYVPTIAQTDPNTPQAGTVWSIQMPTVHSATPFWDIMVNADTGGTVWTQGLKAVLVAGNHTAMDTGGYRFELVQVVPEPSALLAFGSGFVGLVGLAVRRRRA